MDCMRIPRTVINRLILVLMIFFLSVVVFTAADEYSAAEIGGCGRDTACTAPEFPSKVIPLVMIIGSLGAVLYIERHGEF
jgi:hypothetical protein